MHILFFTLFSGFQTNKIQVKHRFRNRGFIQPEIMGQHQQENQNKNILIENQQYTAGNTGETLVVHGIDVPNQSQQNILQQNISFIKKYNDLNAKSELFDNIKQNLPVNFLKQIQYYSNGDQVEYTTAQTVQHLKKSHSANFIE